MKQLLLLLPLSFFVFAGCAAVGVLESNDPKVKLRQGSVLANEQNRPHGAIQLFKEAASLAQEQGEKETEALAEFYIGEIYKNPRKPSESLRNPHLALEHHTKAISLYKEIKYFKSASFVYFNSSSPYAQLNQNDNSCKALKEAKKYATKSDAHPKDFFANLFSDGGLLVSINNLLKEKKCL